VEQIHDYEDACARYLLGELSEQEQTELEEAYFADDDLFERFLAVKDDLVDAYACGDLTGQKRARFEQHFLSSEPRRERVEEARGFIRAVTAASTDTAAVRGTTPAQTAAAPSWWESISRLFASRPLVWQGALAALFLVVLAGSLLLVRQFQSRQAERERVQNEEATRRKQEEERLLVQAPPGNEDQADRSSNTASNESDKNPQAKTVNNKQTSAPAPTQVASLVLLPFNSRDIGGTNSLTLQQDTRAVRLQLVFKSESYSRYDVVLRTVGGEQVLHRGGLKAAANGAGKSVTLIFDPSLLRHQDYIMTLNGLTAAGQLEAIDDYYFRVERTTPQSTPTPKRQ